MAFCYSFVAEFVGYLFVCYLFVAEFFYVIDDIFDCLVDSCDSLRQLTHPLRFLCTCSE